eukprot:gene17350-3227_t
MAQSPRHLGEAALHGQQETTAQLGRGTGHAELDGPSGHHTEGPEASDPSASNSTAKKNDDHTETSVHARASRGGSGG